MAHPVNDRVSGWLVLFQLFFGISDAPGSRVAKRLLQGFILTHHVATPPPCSLLLEAVEVDGRRHPVFPGLHPVFKQCSKKVAISAQKRNEGFYNSTYKT